MQYTVRPATLADLDAVVRIYGGPLAAAGTLNVPYESPDVRRKRSEWLSH